MVRRRKRQYLLVFVKLKEVFVQFLKITRGKKFLCHRALLPSATWQASTAVCFSRSVNWDHSTRSSSRKVQTTDLVLPLFLPPHRTIVIILVEKKRRIKCRKKPCWNVTTTFFRNHDCVPPSPFICENADDICNARWCVENTILSALFTTIPPTL